MAKAIAKAQNPNATRGNTQDRILARAALDGLLSHLDSIEEDLASDSVRYGFKPDFDGYLISGAVGQNLLNYNFEDSSPDESDLADLRYDADRAAAKDEG